MKKFPIYKVDYVFNKFNGKINNNCNLLLNEIEISYPCRLDAMAINPSAVCYNDSMVFTPGEVVISVNKKIVTNIKVDGEIGGQINVSKDTKRKVLVKHAYYLMCDALNISPSLTISVDDSDIPKHCGFGSSSSIIASVAVAINELYGNPISSADLIKYLTSNHGEEITDDNEDELKMVQCIGGGATNGMVEEGIIILAGKATIISKMKYESKILIAMPKDFVMKDAKYLMEEEEKNLWKFKATGDKYSEKIAFNLLHKAIPSMLNGSIKELADVVFDYRFNMGSIENCSFVYPNMINQAKILRKLYENNLCTMLSLSSVGPAYFILENDENKLEECKKELLKLNMKIIESSVCNSKYTVNIKKSKNFWNDEKTITEFFYRKPSKYITDEIDSIKFSNVIDIGCGGGRYSKYISSKGFEVDAVDKNPSMFKYVNDDKIHLFSADMKELPFEAEKYDLILSIGVLHNSLSYEDYVLTISEFDRILMREGKLLISVFTDDVITDDLTEIAPNIYTVRNREPMVLLNKDKIVKLFENKNIYLKKVIDEHITDVGDGGKRNVLSLLFEKK